MHRTDKDKRLADLVTRGEMAARAGKKAEARHFFQQALDIAPDDSDVLLWLAFLAGGGHASLEFVARVLEADPDNQQARAAIRWARKRSPASTSVTSMPPLLSGPRRHPLVTLAGLLLSAFILLSVLVTAAFALGLSPAVPTRVALLIAVPSATPTPSPSPTASPTPSPSPTATATATETPTATATSTATPTPTPTATATPTPVPPTPTPSPLPTVPIGANFRWIDVDLTHQRLVAYEGQTPVRTVIVSTGTWRTPTVTGRFKIYVKYKSAPMSGPGYYLPNVPYIMYFYGGYGLHGTYWHNNFGQPMSHGCVNLPTPQAEWLYNWASVGTPVVVHY